MHTRLIWLVLACYACARVLEVVTGPTPRLGLVALDVVSALAFALVDGAARFGVRGIAVFAALCLAVGNVAENFGIAFGIPFGHYRFLGVMGPRVLNVPILLGLAYVGMAYVSWSVASILLGGAQARLQGWRAMAVPPLAALVMVAWDFAQDPVWSTFLRAWEWRDGGRWFGVPASNFFGWYVTVLAIYGLFALYRQRNPLQNSETPASFLPVVFYALCAGGNMLQVWVAQPVSMMRDAAGASWRVTDILRASALVSLLGMGSFAAVAAVRLRRQATN